MLFGNAERLEFEMPQCLLRVARFRGLDRSEFLDNRQFNGNAFALLSHAERFLRDTLPIASRFETGRIQRIDEPLYPPLATREALANALCHRDYALGGGSAGARGVRRPPGGNVDRSVAFRIVVGADQALRSIKNLIRDIPGLCGISGIETLDRAHQHGRGFSLRPPGHLRRPARPRQSFVSWSGCIR